jgi:hypothetical protein
MKNHPFGWVALVYLLFISVFRLLTFISLQDIHLLCLPNPSVALKNKNQNRNKNKGEEGDE